MRRDKLCLLIILCFLSTISIIGVLAVGERKWVYCFARDPSSGSLYGRAFVEAYAGCYSVNTTSGWQFDLRAGQSSYGVGYNPPSYPTYRVMWEKYNFSINNKYYQCVREQVGIGKWNGQTYVEIDYLEAKAEIWSDGKTNKYSRHG